MTDEVFGLDRTAQYALIGVLGTVTILLGAVALSSYATLAIGVGIVMVAYAAVGVGWSSVAAELGLSRRQRTWAIVGCGFVAIAFGLLIEGLLLAFFVGVLLVVYGGGLAIGSSTE